MAIVGYCHDCGAWVNVREDWSCPNGHAAARVNGWYDGATGQALSPAAPEPAPAPAVTPQPSAAAVPSNVPAAGTRDGFLADLMQTLAGDHGYAAEWGSDTDMVISSNPVDGRWGMGSKRAEYSAALKVVEQERSVYFWEMLKERSQGMTFGTFGSESYTTVGMTRSGTKHESVVGPGSNSWEWGYGTLRKLVEEVAARHGLTVHVVLMRRSATW